MQQHIVIYCNPVDGLQFAGPFDDTWPCTRWAEDNHIETDWWVAPLTQPVQFPEAWHVNVYEVDRAYGGPEEGGWYFDTGRYRPEKSVTFDRDAYSIEQVSLAADNLANRLSMEANSRNVPPVGYTSYHGGRYVVRVEDGPGVDYPAEQPTYS